MNMRQIKNKCIDIYKSIDISVICDSKKRKALLISMSSGIVIFGILMFIAYHPFDQSAKKAPINDVKTISTKSLAQAELSGKLDDINAQLARINQSMNNDKSLSVSDKTSIKKEVNQISNAISGLAKESTVTAISSNLAQETNSLYQKVNDLQKTMALVERQVTQGNYLSPDNLPFKVESVDIWNDTAYAAVFLGNHTALMAQNDTQMGWLFKSVDYQQQQVVLENDKQQLVKIDLKARS